MNSVRGTVPLNVPVTDVVDLLMTDPVDISGNKKVDVFKRD